MMDGRCQTCKWWEKETEGRNVKPRPDWGYCNLTLSSDADPVHPDTLAVAQDWESYKAELQTHETFGCVQHEPMRAGLLAPVHPWDSER